MKFNVGFNGRTIGNAQDRQSKTDGWGFWCAKCGKSLWKQKWEAVPRIPKRKDTANCIILCTDCVSHVRDSGIDEIPYTVLPYYRNSPTNWSEQCKQGL